MAPSGTKRLARGSLSNGLSHLQLDEIDAAVLETHLFEINAFALFKVVNWNNCKMCNYASILKQFLIYFLPLEVD